MKPLLWDIWVYLTEPTGAVVDPVIRYRVRLLSAVLIPITLLTFIGSIFKASPQSWLWITTAGLVLAYILSRTKYYNLAILTSVTVLYFPTSALIVSPEPPTFQEALTLFTYSWVALPVTLSSLLLTARGTLFIASLTFIGTMLVSGIQTEFNFASMGASMGFTSTLFVSIVLATVIRQRHFDERASAVNRLRISLAEKEVLLREIHHRVKNNLQVVSSLLSLQANDVFDPAMLKLVKNSQTRIMAMALIHEKLYQSPDLSKVDFEQYIYTLLEKMCESYGSNHNGITYKADLIGIKLSLDAAVPCGLIINELVSNSFKHAFPGGRTGEILFSMSNEGSTYTIQIQDNGVGFADGYDINQSESLGLKLVESLVQQIDGEITLRGGKGAHWVISFVD